MTDRVLKDHQRRGKRLLPPILAALDDKYFSYSWAVECVPDVLWIAFIQRDRQSRHEMDLIERLCRTTAKTLQSQSAIMKVSSFSRLTEIQKLNILSELGDDCVASLRDSLEGFFDVFPNSPLSFLNRNKETDSHEASEVNTFDIERCLTQLYDRESRLSAITMMTCLYLFVIQGKLKLASGDQSPLRDPDVILDYPNTAESQVLASYVRATVPMMLLDKFEGLEPSDSGWQDVFWEQVEGLGTCKHDDPVDHLPDGDDKHLPEVLRKLRRIIRCELRDRLTFLSFSLKHVEISEVVGALIARKMILVDNFIVSPHLWTPNSAPLFIRALADVFITLSWILKEPETRSRKFILYGLGQVKLEIEHRKKETSESEEGKADEGAIHFLETWLDSEVQSRLLEVNLGSWSGISTRQMAIDSNNLDFYTWTYQPMSGAVHSQWQHLAFHNTVYCINPAHNFHKLGAIRDYKPTVYYLETAIELYNKALSEFDEWAEYHSEAESSLDFLMSTDQF